MILYMYHCLFGYLDPFRLFIHLSSGKLKHTDAQHTKKKMHWLQQGSLLHAESCEVLSFSRTPSIVFKGVQKHNVNFYLSCSFRLLKLGSSELIFHFQDTVMYPSKPLISDDDWDRWLEEDLLGPSLLRKGSDEPSDLEQCQQYGGSPRRTLKLL